jgi:hypothetical protein
MIGKKTMSETIEEQIARTDLQMVIELTEDEQDELAEAEIYVVGDVDLPTLMDCEGLSGERAVEIYDAVNAFVERMMKT